MIFLLDLPLLIIPVIRPAPPFNKLDLLCYDTIEPRKLFWFFNSLSMSIMIFLTKLEQTCFRRLTLAPSSSVRHSQMICLYLVFMTFKKLSSNGRIRGIEIDEIRFNMYKEKAEKEKYETDRGSKSYSFKFLSLTLFNSFIHEKRHECPNPKLFENLKRMVIKTNFVFLQRPTMNGYRVKIAAIGSMATSGKGFSGFSFNFFFIKIDLAIWVCYQIFKKSTEY
ncbi:hypothetical protein BpHYR1_030098 [Brachionus plicatilis]|uniref:Uncharacterized protein n=1 Tax=Brachionus plicatilis TaxID=10195 RepID=A0A3M7QAR5_BRAPC|nr:hypothetical protein BpHYR1_030098 [Brachionus plicatilis]